MKKMLFVIASHAHHEAWQSIIDYILSKLLTIASLPLRVTSHYGKKRSLFQVLVCFFIINFIIIIPVYAYVKVDADNDGISDEDEINIYSTNPQSQDTDNDGYTDWHELNNGYSPHNPKPLKLEKNDTDNDGLNDRMELKFHTNLINPDTDNDGFKDGAEIATGFDPLHGQGAILIKRIEINLAKQELRYFLGKVALDNYPVSSGVRNTTPKGRFTISNKSLKAWSPYGLWMPYWLGITGQKFGLHELPIWPNGYREGADHLGKPVSHGCIRLGIGPAKTLYDWTLVGTSVVIY